MLNTSPEPYVFLDSLDEEDTLVDVHRWQPTSVRLDAGDDDFPTPVCEPETIPIPKCRKCGAPRAIVHRFCRLCGARFASR
jgi:hypothetical protein